MECPGRREIPWDVEIPDDKGTTDARPAPAIYPGVNGPRGEAQRPDLCPTDDPVAEAGQLPCVIFVYGHRGSMRQDPIQKLSLSTGPRPNSERSVLLFDLICSEFGRKG